MRLEAESKLHQLAMDDTYYQPPPSTATDTAEGKRFQRGSAAGSGGGGGSARSSPETGMTAAAQAEGRHREEKWATIARMNKRKVADLETQSRGEERRIVRLERALETEREAREELEDGLAEILANGEDLLDQLHASSSFRRSSNSDEMKQTYGTATPTPSHYNATVTPSQAWREAYCGVRIRTQRRRVSQSPVQSGGSTPLSRTRPKPG